MSIIKTRSKSNPDEDLNKRKPFHMFEGNASASKKYVRGFLNNKIIDQLYDAAQSHHFRYLSECLINKLQGY